MRAAAVNFQAQRTSAPLGGCSPLTPRCADARDYKAELRPCCRGHLVRMMEFIAEDLDEIRATWWADYGTLLGAVRNPLTTRADYPWLPQGADAAPLAPGIIPHDKDADISVIWRDWMNVRRKLRGLVARGFNVVAMENRHVVKVRVSARNHTNVDLFFWRERSDGTMYREKYSQVDACKGREFHRSLLFPLSTVTWEGRSLPAPRDPEAFLAMRYGENWRVPVMANNDGVKR